MYTTFHEGKKDTQKHTLKHIVIYISIHKIKPQISLHTFTRKRTEEYIQRFQLIKVPSKLAFWNNTNI